MRCALSYVFQVDIKPLAMGIIYLKCAVALSVQPKLRVCAVYQINICYCAGRIHELHAFNISSTVIQYYHSIVFCSAVVYGPFPAAILYDGVSGRTGMANSLIPFVAYEPLLVASLNRINAVHIPAYLKPLYILACLGDMRYGFGDKHLALGRIVGYLITLGPSVPREVNIRRALLGVAQDVFSVPYRKCPVQVNPRIKDFVYSVIPVQDYFSGIGLLRGVFMPEPCVLARDCAVQVYIAGQVQAAVSYDSIAENYLCPIARFRLILPR